MWQKGENKDFDNCIILITLFLIPLYEQYELEIGLSHFIGRNHVKSILDSIDEVDFEMKYDSRWERFSQFICRSYKQQLNKNCT